MPACVVLGNALVGVGLTGGKALVGVGLAGLLWACREALGETGRTGERAGRSLGD